MAKNKQVDSTNPSRAGRKSFLVSKKEQYRQYRSYTKFYNQEHKVYGNNMTAKYSYKKFKEERAKDIELAKKLDASPTSLKQFAREQIRTSYSAARTRVRNARANIKEAINKERRGEKLDKIEEAMLEVATEEIVTPSGKTKRVIKDLDWKTYRNEEGALVDLNNKLKQMYTKGEIQDYEEDVFGSP